MPIDSASPQGAPSTQGAKPLRVQQLLDSVQAGKVKPEDPLQKAVQSLQANGVGENTNVVA
jgi:hypothetical protein